MVGYAFIPQEEPGAPMPTTTWAIDAVSPTAVVGESSATAETFDDEGNVTGLLDMSADRMAPNHLFIPSQGVYAPFESHGLDREGALILPPNPRVLTRYSAGASPSGPSGTVLISGHVSKLPITGALYRLADLTPNAVVYLTDDRGTLTSWVVTSMETYIKASLPGKVFSPSPTIRGYLVTCSGPIVAFPDGHRTHRDNIVVGLRRLSVG